MSGRVARKWRPALGLILGCTLVLVLSLPVFGVAAMSWLTGAKGGSLPFAEAASAVIPAVLACAGVTGYVLWRTLLRPISALADRAERITGGDETALAPLDHYGTREMGEMGRAMLDMGRVLRGREAVLRSYADHVTHELKSPLTVLRGAAELLDDPDLSAQDRHRLVQRVTDAAERMTALLDAQRALARAAEPYQAGVSRLGLAAEQIAMGHPGLTVMVERDGAVPLAPDALEIVLGHLIGNAAEHGATDVALSVEDDALRVSDNGPGISEGNAARVFDPFFTTRRDAGGTGMGLAIVARLLEAHGAEIALAPSDAGACFVIAF